jgi:hypothetical protein
MDFTVTIADAGAPATALTKGLAAYNVSHPEAPLTSAQFVQKLVDGQIGALVTSYVVTTVSKLEFMQRFTSEERIAVRTAADSNAAVKDYLEMLNASEVVDLTHALTVAGVQSLEAATLIGAGRAVQILAL